MNGDSFVPHWRRRYRNNLAVTNADFYAQYQQGTLDPVSNIWNSL